MKKAEAKRGRGRPRTVRPGSGAIMIRFGPEEMEAIRREADEEAIPATTMLRSIIVRALRHFAAKPDEQAAGRTSTAITRQPASAAGGER